MSYHMKDTKLVIHIHNYVVWPLYVSGMYSAVNAWNIWKIQYMSPELKEIKVGNLIAIMLRETYQFVYEHFSK